jgi:pilus assembly protein Flp/PilA
MMNLMQMLQGLQARIANGERGAAAVEYALLVSLIAVAIVVAVGLLGGSISDTFDSVRKSIGG